MENIENLIIQERNRKNALNRASYLRRKETGTNKAIKPVEMQKVRGRKPKAIDETEIKNYIPLKTPSNTLFIAKWLNRIVDIAISNAKVAIFVV